MSQSSSHKERRDKERSDSRTRYIGVRIRDIVQHAEPEEGICEAQDGTSDDRRPIIRFAVADKCEPEETDGKEPDCYERGDESCFWAVGAVLLPAARVEP